MAAAHQPASNMSAMEPTLSGPVSIPVRAGIGLRPPHMALVMDEKPDAHWFEVHSENFFGGIEMIGLLERVRRDYPVSLHGVGLSLGSADGLRMAHLEKLSRLIERIEPGLVSEHICWGAIGNVHLNELLPLPYTEEALDTMVERVLVVQEFLGRRILLENLSSYLEFSHSTIPEWEFVAALSRRSGCGLLLDVNNVYVNSINHGFDAEAYIRAMPADAVAEIHLAGHTRKEHLNVPLLIDTHDRRVSPEVWALFDLAVRLLGPKPTLIEWDQQIPDFSVLQAEAALAEELMHAPIAITA
ncbi:hypothetical protein SPV1_06224 [Mariprofundus ferrooxydans PV-1]|uniref:UPF0276 protein SPV1_06224 n=2 Tax=Mariprofundus ferrooxydans TaxID=314344 RepID=Q0EWS6_9PROT|nr:hypothetical protein SPV1_06224 [Mariprofundus ferrooxydans PV-1]